ncbi:MAG: TonB-dependent receptor [Rhodospirillaceae bacterium]|nr:TonB-dependent receptor [Rhodospirillaceae bacterium]MDD9996384.1 TonB-dependent receptor [Rhodospirillaceae bacterium]MDE0362214.1 TonB-dependent receptor [Rhodospirillaceae bacterium]
MLGQWQTATWAGFRHVLAPNHRRTHADWLQTERHRDADCRTGSGSGKHGGYTVLDLGGAYRFGDGDRQRIGIRLENALDEEYASSLGRSNLDVDGSSYPYANLGTPQTLHVAYGYRF